MHNLGKVYAGHSINKVFVNKREMYFKAWSGYCLNRRLRLNRLALLITRSSRQVAFDSIRDLHWDKKVKTKKE